MKKKILKYSGITLICFIALLILTNPSIKQFKEFLGEPVFEDYSMSYKRTSNWLIFSTYEFSYSNTSPLYGYSSYRRKDERITASLDKLTGKYTGFFMNFYKK